MTPNGFNAEGAGINGEDAEINGTSGIPVSSILPSAPSSFSSASSALKGNGVG
jgi:hypothetical protein